MSLLEVKHQGHAQWTIQRALSVDRLPHACLFHGPDGVGKEMLAHGLAQRLVCPQPKEIELPPQERELVGIDRLEDGCGACEDCRALRAGTHPDLHRVYRQLHREHPEPEVRRRKGLDIGIDVIRHFLIERAGFTSVRGRGKVFIVREADRITTQAQNALLKTLEEPPPGTYIILLVQSLDLMLPTTLSRCQIVRFDPLPVDFMTRRLAELVTDLPQDRVRWYARISEGSLGEALRRVDESLFEFNKRLLAGLARFPGQDCGIDSKGWLDQAKSLGNIYRKRDPEISDTEATRRAVKTILLLTANGYADVLRIAGGRTDDVVNAPFQSAIDQMASRLDLAAAADAISRLAEAERQLTLNVNAQLVLDGLLIALTRLTRRREGSTVQRS